jgi:hypothetical protein
LTFAAGGRGNNGSEVGGGIAYEIKAGDVDDHIDYPSGSIRTG